MRCGVSLCLLYNPYITPIYTLLYYSSVSGHAEGGLAATWPSFGAALRGQVLQKGVARLLFKTGTCRGYASCEQGWGCMAQTAALARSSEELLTPQNTKPQIVVSIFFSIILII